MENAHHSKFHEILFKLQQMYCSLLGNGEDWWLKELFFKPGSHRYELVEWFLSKLEFQIQKPARIKSISNKKHECLLFTLSTLGFCKVDDHDLIKGTALELDQLNFWKALVDILWIKLSLSKDISSEKKDESYISQEVTINISEKYEKNCLYLAHLCNNLDLNDLFSQETSFLPPEASKASEQYYQDVTPIALNICDIKELKVEAHLSSEIEPKNELNISNLKFSSTNYVDPFLMNEEEKNICLLASTYPNVSKRFIEIYNILKIYLNIEQQEYADVGPQFETLDSLTESFLKMNESLSTIRASHLNLKEILKKLSEFKFKNPRLSTSFLEEYVSIQKALKQN